MNKILLVDDNPTTNFLHRDILKDAGIDSVNEVMDGSEAYEHIQLNCPDLILLDLNMPVMDGWDFLHKKEQNQLCAHSKVVILSSSNHPDDLQKAKKYKSVIAYLEKPLTVRKIDQLKKML